MALRPDGYLPPKKEASNLVLMTLRLVATYLHQEGKQTLMLVPLRNGSA